MKLSDTFTLGRASRYSDPLDGNACLPVVYGNLSDGLSGNWKLPCISKSGYVYCFADHEVLTVAQGNSIAIYSGKDNTLVNPGDYVFSASNNYQGLGNIATITFTSNQANNAVTVSGMGKAAAGVLVENIVDIVEDFLTVENSAWTSASFDATMKAITKQTFTAKSYKAAGVIDADRTIDAILSDMMGTFLGSWWLSAEGLIILALDTNSMSSNPTAGIISRHEVKFMSASQRLDSVVNQGPVSYAYDYAGKTYRNTTEQTPGADLASQGIYGVRKPDPELTLMWCRDSTSALAIQAIMVDRFSFPVWVAQIEDVTLKRLYLDVGDIACCSILDLYDRNGNTLANNLWKITSVRPDVRKGTVNFTLQDTGAFLNKPCFADSTYVAGGSITAGANRLDEIY